MFGTSPCFELLEIFEEDFESFYNISLYSTNKPHGGANMIPGVMICTNLVEVHLTMLHAKYLSSNPYGSEEEDFLSFNYICQCKTNKPRDGANITPGIMI